jgi:hypothetical protein
MYLVRVVIDGMESHSSVLTVRPLIIQPNRLGVAVLLLAGSCSVTHEGGAAQCNILPPKRRADFTGVTHKYYVFRK